MLQTVVRGGVGVEKHIAYVQNSVRIPEPTMVMPGALDRRCQTNLSEQGRWEIGVFKDEEVLGGGGPHL